MDGASEGAMTTRDTPLHLTVELERETDGRWLADVPELPGVLVYGTTQSEALKNAKLLALDVIGDRLAHGEDPLTGCQPGAACPPFEAAVTFGGVEFKHVAVAC